jgi:hypothetical protein
MEAGKGRGGGNGTSGEECERIGGEQCTLKRGMEKKSEEEWIG